MVGDVEGYFVVRYSGEREGSHVLLVDLGFSMFASWWGWLFGFVSLTDVSAHSLKRT